MKVLFDQGTPVPLRRHLTGYEIVTAFEMGWATLNNGELIRRAEAEGFEALVTTDQNLKYQQDLSNRAIAIVVLGSTSWPRIRGVTAAVQAALADIQPNAYIEIAVPPSGAERR